MYELCKRGGPRSGVDAIRIPALVLEWVRGILVFCGIGVFSLSNTQFDVYLMALFGVLGYVFRKFDCEPPR